MAAKKIKIMLFADTHLGFDFPLRPKLKIRRRGPDFFSNFHKILAYAEFKRPDFLVHGGDLFFRSRVAATIVDRVYKALFDFVNKTGIPIYIVPGNHERSHLPQSLYLAHPLIHVFDRPRYFCLKKNGMVITLHGFPFYRGDIRSQFKGMLKQCGWNQENSKLRLLIVHQAIDGAQVGPADYTFRNRKDVINIRDIPINTSAVLCGHIHRRQLLYFNNVPVFYSGSIERTSFAEKDEQKGFYEIDFVPGLIDSEQWKVERIKFLRLPARPMTDICLNVQQSKNEIQRSIIKQCAALPEDSVIRIRKLKADQGAASVLNMPLIRRVLPASFSLQMGLEFRKT